MERDLVSLHGGDRQIPPIPAGDLRLFVLADALKAASTAKLFLLCWVNGDKVDAGKQKQIHSACSGQLCCAPVLN